MTNEDLVATLRTASGSTSNMALDMLLRIAADKLELYDSVIDQLDEEFEVALSRLTNYPEFVHTERLVWQAILNKLEELKNEC